MRGILLTIVVLTCITELLVGQVTTSATKGKGYGVSVELVLHGGVGGASNNSGNAHASDNSYHLSERPDALTDTINYRIGLGVNLGFDINLFFGKKRQTGLGLGILYSSGYNSFSTDDFKTDYQATDREGRSFRRIISAAEWNERVTYHHLSIPLLFKFRYIPTNKRIGFYADLGPVISLLTQAKTEVSTRLDFEAAYSTSGSVLSYPEQASQSDWLLTRDMVTKHFSQNSSYLNVNDYFDQQYNRGYYVGLDQEVSGSPATFKYRTGFGGLLRMGMIYRATKVLSVSLGGQCFILSSAKKSSGERKPVETPNDFKNNVEVVSMLNYAGSLLTAQYGFQVGLHYQILK